MSAYRRILVAVDGSPTSHKGLREALRLAKAGRAKLCIVHVVDEFYAWAFVLTTWPARPPARCARRAPAGNGAR